MRQVNGSLFKVLFKYSEGIPHCTYACYNESVPCTYILLLVSKNGQKAQTEVLFTLFISLRFLEVCSAFDGQAGVPVFCAPIKGSLRDPCTSKVS